MKYERRIAIVDAFRYGTPYPEWFKWAWITGIAKDIGGKLYVNDQAVMLGDYIVKGVQNEIWSVEQETFDSYYELVKDEQSTQ